MGIRESMKSRVLPPSPDLEAGRAAYACVCVCVCVSCGACVVSGGLTLHVHSRNLPWHHSETVSSGAAVNKGAKVGGIELCDGGMRLFLSPGGKTEHRTLHTANSTLVNWLTVRAQWEEEEEEEE